MLRLLSRPLSVALVLTALLVAGQAGASAAPRSGLVRIGGTALPGLRASARVAATPSSQPVDVTVTLAPRNADLLRTTAARHGRPLSYAQLRARFGPAAATRAAVVRYMRSQGLALASQGLLSMTFSGTADSASQAFHVRLSTYRSPHGRLFRAPDGAASLPADIASSVTAVTGLDTRVRLRPAVKAPRLSSGSPQVALQPFGTLASPCSGAKHAQSAYGGYLPAQLAQAYGHQTLISGGSDGHGESIALVELSNYKHTDMDTFRNCFGLTSDVIPHAVAGGTRDTSGAIEVELDIEVAMAAAPGLDAVHVYVAPNNLGNILPMIEQMVADQGTTGVHIISDSWGLCEALLPPSFVQAESVDLELAAASGMSFYAASGDSGSSGCKDAIKGYTAHVVDDPASQPFVTGVGGTVLHSPDGSDSTAWRAGGGGVSRLWAQPSYQASNPLSPYDGGSKCGNPDGFCRQVPDIAMNASLNNGYVMLCTASSCPPVPWFPAGGTSAGAPLMAGITADANSATNGATRVGFANPLLYSDSAMFWDVTSGTNSTDGTGAYPAGAGYDLATGLGSVNAVMFKDDLATFSPPGITQDQTQLTITAPLTARTIHYGNRVTFRGTLLDQASNPIPDRRVYVELHEGGWIYLYQAQTDAEGIWQIALAKALQRNLTWRAIFTGTDTELGRKVAGQPVYVIPRLGSRSTVSSAPRGSLFTFRGSSSPNMHRATMRLQVRRSTRAAWKTVGTVRVSSSGKFSRQVGFARSGYAYLRWSYRGGKRHPWMSATSPVRRVRIS
ncbi:MAG TPA: S53 family peptidase [Gaiellales bacterium]|nr:S53 family peptidase [Gaiellales bacterium]